jgi:hypothetical protein
MIDAYRAGVPGNGVELVVALGSCTAKCSGGRHRVDGVCDQVQQHMLQLNSIPDYSRLVRICVDFD